MFNGIYTERLKLFSEVCSIFCSFLTEDSTITCKGKGFCTISWNLKADVEAGYQIFITGDPVTLGCWESNMAVLLVPSVESDSIWTAEIKVFLLFALKLFYGNAS